MAVVLTIAGATKAYRKGSLSIPSPVNGRGTASFEVRSNDGTYRTAMDAEVILTEGGTRRFGGLVNRLSEKGTLGDLTGAHEAIATRVSAVDFNQYGERRYVNGTIPAGTMKSQIEYVRATYLDDYGVTLDAGQDDGPTLPDLECRDRLVIDVYKDISVLTGKYGDPYIGNIDYFKVLSFTQPSAAVAPFDVVEGDGSTIGDITVEVSREQYANRILLRVPSKSEAGRIESFTGDGTSGPFTLQYTPTKLYGHILVASGGGETLGLPVDGGQWSYDTVTNSITRDAGVTTIGETYNLYFDGTFTGAATAEDAGEIASYGIWEKVLTVDAVPADTTAQALADAALVQALQTPKTIKYRTFGLGLAPGQSQTITIPLRNLSESCVLTDVTTKDYGKGDRLVRDVTATSGVNPQDSFHAVYKLWAGDRSGGSSAANPTVGTGGPSSGGPAPPFRSVQFNNAGALGGDADFIYYKDENSVVCGGGGSSITAADFESCQVFGSDNHIADPS